MEPLQSHVNVLCTTFPGLGLPKTIALPLTVSTTISTLIDQIVDRLPSNNVPIAITTNSNKALIHGSNIAVSSLVPNPSETILPLRLSVPLCGGKGGFGSQLRAAGGRMSSKKKKNHGDNNGSNRNLDGRRLRTITEAKALAEHLATKPEMEKKEKEARQKRWQQVVDLAEKREEELRSGSKQRIDGRWVEDKTEAVDAVREAVLKAMENGSYSDNLARVSPARRSSGHGGSEDHEDQEEHEADQSTSMAPTALFFGFDEEDDSNSGTEEDSSAT